MKFIRGLADLRRADRGCVFTIGAFDGIHLGHQVLIAKARAHAERLSRPAAMLTFEPTPREFFAADDPPARLTSLRERCRQVDRLGLDVFCLLRFDDRLRNMTSEAFARLLALELNTPQIVVGNDFRFGHGGAADTAALTEAGRRFGFAVDVVEPVIVDGARVSSTGVREALAAGDLAKACEWLGRPYSMIGRVVVGDRLGRTLGYPTANMRLHRRSSPVKGIFAVRVRGIASGSLPGVASLGTRPTVNGRVPLLETYVFDFSGDLYGREIEVEFVAKLRDERHFATLDALVEQMNLDAAAARRELGHG